MSLIKIQEEKIAHLEQELLLYESRFERQEKEQKRERSSLAASMHSDLANAQTQLNFMENRAVNSEKALQQATVQLNDARRQIKALEDRMVEQEAERDQFSQKTISAMRAKFAEDQAKYAQDKTLAEQALDKLQKALDSVNADKVAFATISICNRQQFTLVHNRRLLYRTSSKRPRIPLRSSRIS